MRVGAQALKKSGNENIERISVSANKNIDRIFILEKQFFLDEGMKDPTRGAEVKSITAEAIPKEIELDLAKPVKEVGKRRKGKIPMNSNELKVVSDDVPIRLYCQGLDPKSCDICRKEMDLEREAVVKCRMEDYNSAVHFDCLVGRSLIESSQGCKYCTARWECKKGKYLHWSCVVKSVGISR
jgi:hypothetical protein